MKNFSLHWLVAPLYIALLLTASCSLLGENSQPAEIIVIPEDIVNPNWLETRKQIQLTSVEEFEVFYDFTFTDQLEASGIKFLHRIVDDAGRDYKAVHYDHGNGVAVADVDGDGLYDIYFVNQLGGNQLWRNLGDGKFEDITQESGVAVADRIGVTASFADIDNDGDPDLYVTNVRAGNLLFENDGSGKFNDISQQSGLGYKGHSSGAVFFDYDRDGLLDLFLANVGLYTFNEPATVTSGAVGDKENIEYVYHVGVNDAFGGHIRSNRAEQSILFKNLGGNRFVDVSEQTHLMDISWSGDASPIDVNNDGWPDLYVLNMQGHDEYYENVRGEYFVKKSREIFPKTSWGSMGIKSFDYDNDGDMDIFVTDMHSDMSEAIMPELESLKSRMQWSEEFLHSEGPSIFGNTFFRNDGEGRFVEISDEVGVENYWPWGLSVGDLNADGYEDVFVTSSMNYPFRYGVNSVLLNNRGKKFLDSEFILGVEPRRDNRTATPWFQLDCSDKNSTHRQCIDRAGRVIVLGALGSRSSVIFDIDDDGDLDIITNDFNSEPMVLVSNLTERKNIRFLKIKLIGTNSNRDGLGATVKVYAGGQTFTRVNDGKSGYLSQSLYPLYIGLGDSDTVQQIEVFWPSGRKQVLPGPVETNVLIEITEQ